MENGYQPIGAIGSADNNKRKKIDYGFGFDATPHSAIAQAKPINNIGNFLNGSIKTENC